MHIIKHTCNTECDEVVARIKNSDDKRQQIVILEIGVCNLMATKKLTTLHQTIKGLFNQIQDDLLNEDQCNECNCPEDHKK